MKKQCSVAILNPFYQTPSGFKKPTELKGVP
jgi:hypothetical protein